MNNTKVVDDPQTISASKWDNYSNHNCVNVYKILQYNASFLPFEVKVYTLQSLTCNLVLPLPFSYKENWSKHNDS